MREIKFRAWDKHDNKMVQVDGVDSTTSTFPSLLAVGFHGLPIAIDDNSFKENEIVGWNVDHKYELMQYTGLLDKNGVEIYEDDIIKVNYVGNFLVGSLMDFGGEIAKHELASEDIEVIGNVHENGELLNES